MIIMDPFMEEKIFKYKLDFYYQQSLIYLLTLVMYAGIRGSFIEDQFSFVFRDPICTHYYFVCCCIVCGSSSQHLAGPETDYFRRPLCFLFTFAPAGVRCHGY